MPVTPTVRANLTSRVKIYRSLRRSIIMGHRRPGERLDVEELARQYATSVTPVRDAIQMLNQEGLVSIEPRSGYFISHITLKELRDIFELRKILELVAIERAVLRITDMQVTELRNVNSGYSDDSNESRDRCIDENRRFHYLIAVASGNQELARIVGRLHDRLARFMVLCHAVKSQEMNHSNIVNALQARDVDAARQALLDDIVTSHDAILDSVLEKAATSWRLDAPPPG